MSIKVLSLWVGLLTYVLIIDTFAQSDLSQRLLETFPTSKRLEMPSYHLIGLFPHNHVPEPIWRHTPIPAESSEVQQAYPSIKKP
jgi:hypothetical protein